MIIDSHAHIGKILNFNMAEDMLLESMDIYNISFSLISNGEAAEVDHDQNPIPVENQFRQIELNERLLKLVEKHQDKLGALLWVKPVTEGCTTEFEELIVKNRELIYGIKVHPYHSKLAFNSEEIDKYIQLARKYDLPVVTHTAGDYESSPELVYEVALKYPDVNFVMVHMGLGTDNEKAIELISKLPNIYGDTTWVLPEKGMKAIEVCGIDKIMFGSDNPINGVDTYNDDMFYNFYLEEMEDLLSEEGYEKFTYKNAEKLFKIKAMY